MLEGQGDPVNGGAGGEDEGVTLNVVDVDTRDAAGNGGEIRLRGRGGNSGVEVIASSMMTGIGDINVFGTTVFFVTRVRLGHFGVDRCPVLPNPRAAFHFTCLTLLSLRPEQKSVKS